MNIHEHQAKDLFRGYNIPVSSGSVAYSADEIERVVNEVVGPVWVVKAQIHAGGRGKGGGVKVVSTKEDALNEANKMYGMNLVTPQTSKEGKKVNKVLVCEDVYEPGEFEIREFYFSILLDRKTSKNVIVYSTEGGMDIEEVAEKTPELIFKEIINPGTGVLPFQARKIAFNLGLKGVAFKEMLKFVNSAYNAYLGSDSSLVEINPLILTEENNLLCLDAKMNFDDNSIFRHPEILELRDLNEEDPTEIEASKHDLAYIKLDGSIGCMVNGAGLAMATMDIIKLFGEEPANFLDVGGGASKEKVSAVFKIILSDKNVKGILINIFGGIMRCDILAQGVVEAAKEIKISVPLVVRLAGTNYLEGKNILDNSGLEIISASDLSDAAKKIVKEIK